MMTSKLLVAAIALAAPLFAVDEAQTETLLLRERSLGVMGTDLKVKVLGKDEKALEAALDAAVLEIQRVEDLMTDWRPSPLMTMNAAAGKGPVEVPKELAVLIARGLELGKQTGGAFDITYAGAGQLWDYKSKPPKLPDEAAIKAALALVDYQRVTVDLEKSTVNLPAGMRIGLGGIAKGYGVDRAMAVLLEHKIEHGMVGAGGDLKLLGLKHGELWKVAVRHPRDPARVLALLPVSNTCVMTSGDYERFFEHEGKRYHHILDPRTGYPATGGMSATVIAQDAAYADSLATALCVLGPEEGIKLVESLPRVEALVVSLDGQVHYSSGLKGK